MISNLPAIIVGNAPPQVVPKRDTDRITDDANRTRFIIDAPEPKVRGGFNEALLLLDSEQAANQAGNFQLLLKEQQQSQEAANNNEPYISPFVTASNAYIAAENAAAYSRPTATYLGSI